MGFYLDPEEPAGRLAAFSAPNPRASLHAKYGFATVQASLKLAQRYPENLGRQNFDFGQNLKTSLLNQQCPLRGIPRCAPPSKRYRTADGTCNNIEEPWKGSSMTPMQRFLPPTYEDGIQSPRLSIFNRKLPSSRKISTTIHRDRNRALSSITLMFMQWGQFLDHDVTSTATSRAFNNSVPRCCLPGSTGFLPVEFTHPECMAIEVPHDDWFLSRFGIRCMEFIRSAPTTRINCDLGWREQINQVTSYIDGSMIYGSDVGRAESLRTFRGGQLQYGRRGHRSPPDPPDGEICHTGAISTACFLGGDSRFGEQPALTALHTIWLRFHNKITKGLQNFNAHWSDEKLYQEARKIVAALIQHITYREFLPILLGREVMDLFELKLLSKEYYSGYDRRTDPTTANAFSTAAFRFGHSLVQNSFVRSTINHQRMLNNVSIHHEQENPENIWSHGSLDRLILGLSNQPSQMRDEFIGDELTNHLFQSNGAPFGMDLAAINIQRGRDHGIPPYISWRQPCGLTLINNWEDLSKIMPIQTVQLFQSLYENIDDIDLYSGGLAEKPVRGGIVGPVFACIIAQQFLNYRKGDRFWYENGHFKSSFTPGQLQEIRKVNFAQVVCHTIDEIHNIQPFIFIQSDDSKNPRTTCRELLKHSLDLLPWSEVDFNSVNLNGNFENFETFQSGNENILKPAPQNENFLESFEREDGDFDFEKGFQQTVEALNQINSQTLGSIDDKLEILNIEHLNKRSDELPKIFFKRNARGTDEKQSKKYNVNDLVFLRNLKNIKINDYIDGELKKSANISSEITVLPKSNYMVKRKIINDTVLLVNSERKNSSVNSDILQNQTNLLKTAFRSNTADNIETTNNVRISSLLDDLFDAHNLHELNENIHNFSKINITLTPNSTKISTDSDEDTIEDSDDQKLRHIDEYILDTLSDYYYDTDYEAQGTKNKNKPKKQSTSKSKVTRRKTTPKLTLEHVTNKPDKSTFSNLNTETYVDMNDDADGPELIFMNYENGQRPYDYLDDVKHGDNLDDNMRPQNNAPNYQFNININYMVPTVKPTQNTDIPTQRHKITNTNKDRPLLQVSLINNNRESTETPINQHNSLYRLTTKRPNIATNFPTYVYEQDKRITNKLTYVTGYMIEGTTKRTNDIHNVPVFISKKPNRPGSTDKTNINNPVNHGSFEVSYESIPGDHTTKPTHGPIIILKPQGTDNNFDLPINKRPSYSTIRPQVQTTRRPNLPIYLYTYDGTHGTNERPTKPDKHQMEILNRRPINDQHDRYEDFETIIHVKRPTKLTATEHNSNSRFDHVDDKLDFKTKLLPHRLKTSEDKKFVKISSVRVGYGHGKENSLETKEAGDTNSEDDVILPELEGINVVQIDILPSDDKYKPTTFNVSEDTIPMPIIPKLYADADCSSELPKPISNSKTTPSAA